MDNPRTYGKPPFTVAVIHGGPGAAGEMAPVARELAPTWGVLEPLQTADSLAGQVEELRAVLEEHGDPPLTLVGFSWGAWLSFLLAATYPALVDKLVLVGSGPYEARCAAAIDETRLRRLGTEGRAEVEALMGVLGDPAAEGKSEALARLGALLGEADAYDPIEDAPGEVDVDFSIFERVWREAAALRRSGRLLALAAQIRCPVVAIHGDYDPHPAEGVRKPLSAALERFRFILLPKCGHKPWIERQARERFYEILREELD